MFDADLVLADGSAAWTYANIVTSTYGVPTSTTINDGGFAVIDLGKTGVSGLSVVAIFPTLATKVAGNGALNLTIEACASAAFGSAITELLTFGGATIRVLVVTETPAVYIGRISTTLQYVRAKAVMAADNDYKLAKVYLTPMAYNVL